MSKRSKIIAEIVSCATGIPEYQLKDFYPLKDLLEVVDSDVKTERRFDFGIFTFIWNFSGRANYFTVMMGWSSSHQRMLKLEHSFWPFVAKPASAIAHFVIKESGS